MKWVVIGLVIAFVAGGVVRSRDGDPPPAVFDQGEAAR